MRSCSGVLAGVFCADREGEDDIANTLRQISGLDMYIYRRKAPKERGERVTEVDVASDDDEVSGKIDVGIQ